MKTKMDRFLDAAIEAALVSGEYLLHNFGTVQNVQLKESHHSVLAAADLGSDTIIRNTIRKYFPNHKYVSEESNEHTISDGLTWVIDPIDGSSYYAKGISTFSISIALLLNYEVILGVVYCPVDKELFFAMKGNGTYLDYRKVYVSSEQELSTSIVSIGHSVLRSDTYELTIKRILKSVRSIRTGGSCAQELCYIACGRIEGLISLNQSVWDYAAGKIIVEEAGGSFSNFCDSKPDLRKLGKKDFSIVATNSKVHEHIISDFIHDLI